MLLLVIYNIAISLPWYITEAITGNNLCLKQFVSVFFFLCVEGQENEAGDGNRANANENVGAGGGQQGNQWGGIVKEIQMIIFGFITSLLSGFHNID